MAKFQVFRETALPASLQPYSLYFVAPPAKPDYVELYVSDSTGSSAKRIIREEDIQTLINNSIAELASLEVVANITERNALAPTTNQQVLVLDATGDPTVTSGAATYIYQASTDTWFKVSEFESLDLDLTVNWIDIVGRPTSTPAQIDTAVANSHTHANKIQLDKIGEDGDGHLTYNGASPLISWTSTAW